MDPETLLRELVRFKTVNNPINDVYPDVRIIKFIETLIKSWAPEIQVKIFEQKGYSSLYLTKDLDTKCTILFMGHLDVVPVTKGWVSDPFTLKVDSGLAFGRGAKDCKGSVVSALLMLQKLYKEQNEVVDQLGFFFSTDEETGGHHGAKIFFDFVKENKILPNAVINVDGGPQVVHKRRAGFGVRIKLPPKQLKTTGKMCTQELKTRVIGDETRHSAYFVQGCDTHAVITLSKLLYLNQEWVISNIDGSWLKGNVIPDEIIVEIVKQNESNSSNTKITYDEYLTSVLRRIKNIIHLDVKNKISSDFGITVNPNLISYSQKDGTEIYFDVRAFLNSNDVNDLVNAFKSRLGDLNDVTTISCPGTTGYFYTPLNTPLVKVSSSVLTDFSLKSKPCEQEGASDARYASIYGIPVIDLGPKGGRIHGNDEFIDLNSMNNFALIYEKIVKRLLNIKNKF
ncbi:MAG: M20/M25/M40 family metallo-hydrolase [Candidatus Hodarchaeota archaeon]